MTCLEKLKQEQPDVFLDEEGLPADCPRHHGYLDNPEDDICLRMECEKCWNREIPEEKLKFEYQGKPIAKVKDIVEENGGITAVIERTPAVQAWIERMEEKESRILDSGNRTQFESGAVRDMREGKGRCDLMPLDVVYKYFELANAQDKVLWYISLFQKNGLTLDLYNAIESFCTVCWTCDPVTMFLEVAKHFEEGAKKYGPDNWRKSIPVWCYIDSAVRHYLKWKRGDKDEPHDRAFVWNLLCCIWEVDYSPRAKGENGTELKSADFLEKHLHISNEEENVVARNPDKWVRLGDYPTGLFEFGGKIYVKYDNFIVVRVKTGAVEQWHPDILVWPIEIEEDAE